MDSFFHCLEYYAVLNSGFVNDCYKKISDLSLQKYKHFPNLQKYFHIHPQQIIKLT